MLTNIDQIHTTLQTTKPGGEQLFLAVHTPVDHTHKQLQTRDVSWLNSQNAGLGDWLVQEIDSRISLKVADRKHKAWMRNIKHNAKCYGAQVITKNAEKWIPGYEEIRACSYCTAGRRPCILNAQISTGGTMLVVLPVLDTEDPENIDWSSKDTWIRGASKAKPT